LALRHQLECGQMQYEDETVRFILEYKEAKENFRSASKALNSRKVEDFNAHCKKPKQAELISHLGRGHSWLSNASNIDDDDDDDDDDDGDDDDYCFAVERYGSQEAIG
jgi:hypothetical protein